MTAALPAFDPVKDADKYTANGHLNSGPQLAQPRLWRIIASASAEAIAHALRDVTVYGDAELERARAVARRTGNRDAYERCHAEIKRRSQNARRIESADAKRARKGQRRQMEAAHGGWRLCG